MKFNLTVRLERGGHLTGEIDVAEVEVPPAPPWPPSEDDPRWVEYTEAMGKAIRAAHARMAAAITGANTSPLMQIDQADGYPITVVAASVRIFFVTPHDPEEQGVWL